jgi:purine-binding chemotaxis protein CheW
MKRATIDWSAVQARLRASELALEQALTPNPQRVQDAYRQRAARLASVEINHASASPGFPALVFRLGQERYAIEMKELAEVLPFTNCVPVPGGSRRFLGVVNLRGEIRAVLDLGHLLGASESGNGHAGYVLMIRRAGRDIGLKIDRIEELREMRQSELMPAPPGGYRRGLVSGTTLVLLSVDAVLEAAFSKEESRIT